MKVPFQKTVFSILLIIATGFFTGLKAQIVINEDIKVRPASASIQKVTASLALSPYWEIDTNCQVIWESGFTLHPEATPFLKRKFALKSTGNL